MTKAFFFAVLMFVMPAFAAEMPVRSIFVYPDVLEYAITKHFSVMDRNRVAQEWENRMDDNGMVTQDDIRAVCRVGRIGDAECNAFQKDIVTYFYDVCEKSSDKGKSDCVKDFWAVAWGTWVRLPEAIGIAKEYALVKHKEKIVCSSNPKNVNPPARASYVKCTSVDGGHFYEFKYNSTTETDDRNIINGTLRAVGKIHDIEFQNSDCTLERIYSDSSCALSYKTSDTGQCDKINKSLNRFGYSSKVITSDKFGKRCEVFGLSGGNRTAYGIDNTVFKDVQYVAGPEVEKQIKAYVQKELERQNVKLQTFKCDSSTKHVYNNAMLDGLVKEHSEVLTCYVNGSPIDFIFDDLSEGKGYAKDAGLSKMACAQLGGQVDGKKCRGLDEEECALLGNKLIARGEQGTKYLREKGGCTLSAAATERAINLLKEIAAGVALTVVTDGAATIPVIVSIGSDLAFEAVQIWQDKIPYKDFKEFMSEVENCENMNQVDIVGDDSLENAKKYCMGATLNQYAGLMTTEIKDLAPDVQVALIERMSEISDFVGDQEIVYVIPAAKKMRNYASFALFGGLLIFNPEKWGTKSRHMVNEFTRLQLGASKHFGSYLEDFLIKGLNRNLPMERLSNAEWRKLNEGLKSMGVELVENANIRGYMMFRRLSSALDYATLSRKASQNFEQYLKDFLANNKVVNLPRERLTDAEWDALNEFLLQRGVKMIPTSDGYMQFTRIKIGGDIVLDSGRIIRNNRADRAQESNGFVYFFRPGTNGHRTHETGLKIHIAVAPEDVEAAIPVVKGTFWKSQIGEQCKVVVDTNWSGNSSQFGKEFTLYLSPEGYYNMYGISKLVSDLEFELKRAGIHTRSPGANVINGDRPVQGSSYMYYSYGNVENGKVVKDYVSGDAPFSAPEDGDIMDYVRVRYQIF